MNTLLLFLGLSSMTTFAAQFDIDQPQILGQYSLATANQKAEIEDVKIIYDNDNVLVLVRDGDQEYALEKADSKGVIFQGEDEPNCGSGDEPSCYYDASITVKLGETKSSHGKMIPQVTITVERIDAYEANEDYTYSLIFNWSSEIEDAVPFFFNTEKPTELSAILEDCKKAFKKVIGSDYMNNRVCHDADVFKIRENIDPKKAFKKLQKGWDAQSLKMNELEQTLFQPSDKYIADYAANEKKAGGTQSLIAASKQVRQYIYDTADAVAYSPEVGSIAWLFVLDSKNRMMYRYAIFMRQK